MLGIAERQHLHTGAQFDLFHGKEAVVCRRKGRAGIDLIVLRQPIQGKGAFHIFQHIADPIYSLLFQLTAGIDILCRIDRRTQAIQFLQAFLLCDLKYFQNNLIRSNIDRCI